VAHPAALQFGDRGSYMVRFSAFINFFYFYCVDADFVPFFLKFSTYFPYTATLWLMTELSGESSEFRGTGPGLCGYGSAPPSLPGAGAKQEQRLFRDLPELLSTAAAGPVMGRGFSVSAGQRMVEIILGVK
jgi:hypothetical protein